jgi:putative ABC transport system permease protein
MWKNYLKIAYRNLKRRPGYAAINVGGLAVGMAACLLIGLWIRHELSYDDFHEKADRIYRLITETPRSSVGSGTTVQAPQGLRQALASTYPEIETATSVGRLSTQFVRYKEQRFYEENIYLADSSFFDVFSFELIKGRPKTALDGPDEVVLTEEVARRYFGSENPIGKTLKIGRSLATVGGVVKKPPSNSHFTFDILANLSVFESEGINWNKLTRATYFVLSKQPDPQELEQKFNRFLAGHPDAEAEWYALSLQSLTSIHLYSHYDGEFRTNGDIRYLYVFGSVGLLILLMACFNFMNLATARSLKRAQEVGVRKTVGATPWQIARQFLSEALLLTLAAFLIALFIVGVALPVLSSFTGANLRVSYAEAPWMPAFALSLALVTGLVAGSYPAFYLSRFEATQVFRGTARAGSASAFLRRGLVVFQFALSTALILTTLIVFSQLHFIQQKDLGFDEERVLVISNSIGGQYEAFKDEALRLSGVAGVTRGTKPSGPQVTMGFEDGESLYRYGAGEDYFETLGLRIVEGRGFSEAARSHEGSTVLTESAVKQLDLEDPVGDSLEVRGRSGRVIGIVEDFHSHSLRKEVVPIMVRFRESGWVMLKLRPGKVRETLDQVKAVYEEVGPDRPIRYSFLNEEIDALYRAEKRFGKVFGVFAGLALFIACLGLFGLAAYAAERRTQEIGIRKTFGASTTHIVGLLSKDFAKLVLIAFVVAAPVAWYAMSRWLQDFAYRVELSPWVFLGVGVAALLIALATVGYHALRAAWTNPADALRYE